MFWSSSIVSCRRRAWQRQTSLGIALSHPTLFLRWGGNKNIVYDRNKNLTPHLLLFLLSLLRAALSEPPNKKRRRRGKKYRGTRKRRLPHAFSRIVTRTVARDIERNEMRWDGDEIERNEIKWNEMKREWRSGVLAGRARRWNVDEICGTVIRHAAMHALIIRAGNDNHAYTWCKMLLLIRMKLMNIRPPKFSRL